VWCVWEREIDVDRGREKNLNIFWNLTISFTPNTGGGLTTETRCLFHQHFSRSFYACRSRKCKKIQLSHQCLLTPSGSARVKVVRRMLMKLNRGRRCSWKVIWISQTYFHANSNALQWCSNVILAFLNDPMTTIFWIMIFFAYSVIYYYYYLSPKGGGNQDRKISSTLFYEPTKISNCFLVVGRGSCKARKSVLILLNLNLQGVNFINVLCAHFLYKILVPKITKLSFGFEAYNVDEIDSRKKIITITITITI